MKETKKFFESSLRDITLNVVSNLSDVNVNALEPLWQVLERTPLIGKFTVCIKRKIQGMHTERMAVKVVGLGQFFASVRVKCQCSPEYCYLGDIAGKKDDGNVIAGSLINQELQAITGISWYNPENESCPKREREDETAPPLGSVSTVLVEAMPPLETSQLKPAPAVEVKKKTARGISSFERAKAVFQGMMRKLVDTRISSRDITEIITVGIADFEAKGVGPVISAWMKKGWLHREYKRNNTVFYSITSAAVAAFDLSDLSAVTPVQPSPPSPTEEGLLGALRIVREKAEKYQTARNSAYELELRKMQLEDDLKKIDKSISDLQPILGDADMQNAAAILENLSKYQSPS